MDSVHSTIQAQIIKTAFQEIYNTTQKGKSHVFLYSTASISQIRDLNSVTIRSGS